jgi:hypothetical protein
MLVHQAISRKPRISRTSRVSRTLVSRVRTGQRQSHTSRAFWHVDVERFMGTNSLALQKRQSASFSLSSSSVFLCVISDFRVSSLCFAVTFHANSDRRSREGGFTPAVPSWNSSRGQARLPDCVWLSCSKHRGYPICVTRVTQKTRKFAGQKENRGLNALFSIGSVSHEPSGTALEQLGTSGTNANPRLFSIDFRWRTVRSQWL